MSKFKTYGGGDDRVSFKRSSCLRRRRPLIDNGADDDSGTSGGGDDSGTGDDGDDGVGVSCPKSDGDCWRGDGDRDGDGVVVVVVVCP